MSQNSQQQIIKFQNKNYFIISDHQNGTIRKTQTASQAFSQAKTPKKQQHKIRNKKYVVK